MGNTISNSRGAQSGSWWHSSSNGHVPTNLQAEPVMEEPALPVGDLVPVVPKESEDDKMDSDSEYEDSNKASTSAPRVLSPAKAKEMEEFHKQLALKREARKQIIAEKTSEMVSLRQQLETERRLRLEALSENNALRALIAENNINVPNANVSEPEASREENNEALSALAEMERQFSVLKDQSKVIKAELASTSYALQSVNTETELLNKENFELKNQIRSLKEVNTVSKQMLSIRESQLTQLKEKLSDIEKSLADREMKTLSSDLRREYERQLENIRNLRVLYEERARVAEATRQNLVRDLEDQKIQTETKEKKCGELQERIDELEKELSDKDDMLGNKESQLGFSKAETKGLQAEMTVINELFSQMLLGYNNTQDLDKLLLKLEENHDLLTDMVVREDCSEVASALPKLILDLVKQIDASETPPKNDEPDQVDLGISEDTAPGPSKPVVTSANEIVGNLPKVWRVLMELLSHQSGPPLVIAEISEKSANSCYNSVDTPSGPRLVPSVSKTYIRLKDLILEKKSLQKEMNRLKQLNSHLENRLQDQERRLGLVSSELSKTWHVVGRMQRQHQQLHTHEKILRYELHEKRLMLTELKEELEFCKDKWDRAKQKNSESQIEWDKLRLEFSSRKVKSSDSAESGYSDEKASDDDSAESDPGNKAERKKQKRKAQSSDGIETERNEIDQKDTGPEKIDDIHGLCDEDNDNEPSNTSEEDQANLADVEDHSVSEVDSSIRLGVEEIDGDQDTAEAAGSSQSTVPSYDEVLASRNARLKKLEEQCYVLVHKVSKNSKKGVQLCNRLEELHNQYGGGDTEQPSTSQQNVESGPEVKDNTVLENVESETQEEKLLGESFRVLANQEEDIKQRLGSVENTIEGTCSNDDLTISISDKGMDDEKDLNLASVLCDGAVTQDENKETISDKEIKSATVTSANNTPTSSLVSDYEARFLAREERLKRMEEQAKSLVNKVSNTSTRSVEICSKLDELHSTYGQEEQSETVLESTAEVQPNITEDISDASVMMESQPACSDTKRDTIIEKEPEK